MALSMIPGIQGSVRDGLPLIGAFSPGLWSSRFSSRPNTIPRCILSRQEERSGQSIDFLHCPFGIWIRSACQLLSGPSLGQSLRFFQSSPFDPGDTTGGQDQRVSPSRLTSHRPGSQFLMYGLSHWSGIGQPIARCPPRYQLVRSFGAPWFLSLCSLSGS